MEEINNFFTPQLKKAIILFISLNIFLYLFIINFHDRVPFHTFNYKYNAHHYIDDSRISGGGFNLISALAQYDAQWYLKIAQNGYPTTSIHETLANRSFSGIAFAFFPLYPLLIATLNLFFSNVLLSAFVLSNLLLVANFLSLVFIISRFKTEVTGIKTAFLLFLFPFSIFYRSYFTEGLFLFFLIWFSHFFVKKKYTYSSILLGLLNTTRGSGVLLYFPYYYYLIKDYRKGIVTISEVIKSLVLSLLPVFLWMVYVFHKTHDLFYFMKTRSAWNGDNGFIGQFVNNINKIFSFSSQALHSFHSSKIDIIVIVGTLILLLLSYGKLNKKLWLISFCLFLTPLIFSDSMSYARYQTISFPLFLFITMAIKTRYLVSLVMTFTIGLLFVSIIFINWYWVG